MGVSTSLMCILDGKFKRVKQGWVRLVQVGVGGTGEIADTQGAHPEPTVEDPEEVDIEPIVLGTD